jgi:hypothetical protein
MKIRRSLLLGIFVLGAGFAQFPANAVTLPAHFAADSAVMHVTFVKKDHHHKKKHFYKAHKHAHLHKHLKKKH